MLFLLIAAGCSTPANVTNNYYETIYEVAPDTGIEEVPAAVEDTGWQDINPPAEIAANVTPEEFRSTRSRRTGSCTGSTSRRSRSPR
ncbi:MAG: hypothetical protein WCO25_05555 [Candidatus Uhrbacteria bacterium]